MAMSEKCFMIEDKGKEYGSYIKSGEFIWFLRETGSAESRRGTIVFLQGAPTQSYSYRVVMSEMSGYGFHCFAPDWIGFGFSDKPQPGYGFDYTEKEFHEEFNKLLDVLGGQISFFPRCSGSFGLTWALKNPSKILKLAILNSLLTVSSPIPGLFQKLSSLPGCLLCHIITSILSRRFGPLQTLIPSESSNVLLLSLST
ncbi:hypothetical protein ACJW30_05G072200 [Castanea mollissima]